ncbi:MAG: PilZ domain-containing protein [Candidatus Binatia bacterium]
MAAAERRAFPRRKVPPGSYAWFPEGASAIADLSLGGVRVDDPEPLLVGTRLKMRLHVAEAMISCTGVVRRTVSNQCMGIQFAEFPEGERSRLHALLFRLEH